MFWINSRRYYFCARSNPPVVCSTNGYGLLCEFICHKIDGGGREFVPFVLRQQCVSPAMRSLSKVTARAAIPNVKSPLFAFTDIIINLFCLQFILI
jgi:hypothetical protein